MDIFFPASGNYNGTTLNNRGSNGNYWSSSYISETNAYNMNFNSDGVNPANNNNRRYGFSVRAVQQLPCADKNDSDDGSNVWQATMKRSKKTIWQWS